METRKFSGQYRLEISPPVVATSALIEYNSAMLHGAIERELEGALSSNSRLEQQKVPWR